jgi:hypothetical protein
MIRLLIGLLFGAGLMYLFDSRHGSERRRMITDRVGWARHKADFSERADADLQADGESAPGLRERVQAAAGRVGETLPEVKEQARGWADATRERAHSIVANGNAQS